MAGKIECQQSPHRFTANENAVAFGFEFLVRLLDGVCPIVPTFVIQIFGRGVVTWEERRRNGIAARVEVLAERAHLGGRCGIAVDEERAGFSGLPEKRIAFEMGIANKSRRHC